MRPRSEQLLDYSIEGVQRIKLWMERMQSKGQKKYFEIFVDSIRVVQKTDSLNEFDEYLQWMDIDTQLLRISVYNTEKSHRSQNFLYATSKYIQDITNEQLIASQRDRIERLIEELAVANKKIEELEVVENVGTENTDLSSLLSLFGTMSVGQPALAKRFSTLNSKLNESKKESDSIGVHDCGLSEENRIKLKEITSFLEMFPAYIEEIHKMVVSERIAISAFEKTTIT